MKKTFEYDDQLPSLPLPTLEHTLERYLDSVRAVVENDDEYNQTKERVEQFRNGQGKEFHELLKKRAQSRNWLAKWWDEEIYLKYRLSIAPCFNMMGFSCLVPPKEDSQIERTSIHMHASALVFQSIREERYPISFMGKSPMTMYQLKNFYNTCRIPKKDCDEILNCFRTISEDEQLPPTHVVVFCNGHIFTFDLYDSKRLLTPIEIREKLEDISKQSQITQGIGLGALTALPRDDWAEIREYLCRINEENRKNLHLIETALLVYAFENENANDLTELAKIGMLKNPESRWFDRSNIYIVTRNGLVVTNGDHAAFEGIIPLQIGDHLQYHYDEIEKITSWSQQTNQNLVYELHFQTDPLIINAIHRGINLFIQTANSIDLLVRDVHQCTKDEIKKYVRIHPDTFFQLSLQLAYYKIHNFKPAATYETASTRRFYRGRTETLRTCTNEIVQWCRSMTNNRQKFNDNERRQLFYRAANRHQELMLEASDNQGCDRHLFGLSMIAYEIGQSFDLINDPSWIKSGGSGNFLLSTSCLGFGVTSGGTAPMCLNGYGVFYRLGNDAITFVVTAYQNSRETNAQQLADCIEETLVELKTLFLSSNL